MPKRGDRVAPPPRPGEWDLRFADSSTADGWDLLCSDAPGPALSAWEALRADPRSRSQRQHPLKGDFATRSIGGRPLEQAEARDILDQYVRTAVAAGLA